MKVAFRGLLAVLFTACLSGIAQAASEQDIARLKEYFSGQGPVHYELYAPLSSVDQPVGGAVFSEGTGGRLEIARVQNGNVESLLTQSLPEINTKPPFTFLLTGAHLLTYITRDWMDLTGQSHRRGDLKIYDLISEDTPQIVFELNDVCDLSFQSGGALSTKNLLSQPAPHFLNNCGWLPIKHNYCWLNYDMDTKKYSLHQHLTGLPDAAEVDAANLNNRAILRYREGRLLEASSLLTQADNVAEADQSIIVRNQALVNSEIDDIGIQADKFPAQPASEALEYFWQGNYLAVLRVMDAHARFGYAPEESAIFGLALAREDRWPDSDKFTAELERAQPPFLADYYWELVKIAYSQQRQNPTDVHRDIANKWLLKLELVDPRHPGYIVGLSRLLRDTGELGQSEQVLEQYVFNPVNAERNLAEPRLELFELYSNRAYLPGCDQLVADALRGPVIDLLGYVLLLDYADYSTALVDVTTGEENRIIAPEKPLEMFNVQ
ncbi:hypothetical protein JW859_04075 [bacterium]|nr:hypothetical protein [bacterium]